MKTKSMRGFASMDPKKQKEIARQGGRAAHAKGTGHEWTTESARIAGHKGGQVRAERWRQRQSGLAQLRRQNGDDTEVIR